MNAALLVVLLAGLPPQSVAPPQSCLPPAEGGSFRAWFQATDAAQRADVSPKPANVSTSPERVDGVTACPCGERCECEACECPDCPHRKPPHLVASVWSSGCVHGERWLSESYPELLAKGWRIEVRRVPSDSGVACPTFTMGDRTWSGYTSKASHFAALKPESVRVTHDAQRHEAAKPVQTQPARLFVPRLPGTEWSGPEQSRESIIHHLLSHPNHRGKYTAAQLHALDYRSLENLHDNDHNRHPPSSSIRSSSSQPVTYQSQSGGCPGGACPSPQRSGGLFGFGLFR